MHSTEELHELASLQALSKELCHKQAWKIANATAGPAKRGMVIHRYEQIAKKLYSHRRRPLSADQVKCVIDAEERFMSGVDTTRAEAKFCRVKTDRGATGEKKKQAAQKLEALWKKRDDRRMTDWIAATDASGTFPVTRADRLLARWRTDRKKFYWKFARIIKRYCEELEKGRPLSSTHGPLLEMLCVEWRRNDKALWQFLSACFRTWDDLKNNPQSVLRRRIVIHQMAPVLGHSTVRIQSHLQKIRTLPPVNTWDLQQAQEKLITKDISRGLSKARTRSFGGW